MVCTHFFSNEYSSFKGYICIYGVKKRCQWLNEYKNQDTNTWRTNWLYGNLLFIVIAIP